ncbi:YqaJ viral recombinase family protein [Jeotgalibacillus haloalkalitolerans]|uniref:YqaJ viral recombinase family protein n=1 Tax=Jeotgalibacillus haloalkalitolerans TaxID=3104292 RepID=A0ABU5KK32_9BACL|nr:YqaJ viral recombinase family protein [Jeotgalibacillus sp. HH7-29]MDZ5711624.1 YqaJ viral recombinase family protein [Jeotgalibacillus sp. HH7-29]
MRQLQVVESTNDMTREEWLQQRKKGIGGSDVGAILGINKWKSPIQVYFEKIGEYSEEVDNEAVEWGNILESVVAEQFAKKTGYKIRKKNAVLQHPDEPWALANVDRLINAVDERGPGVLEVKTASEYVRNQWEDDEIPSSYLVQLQWYLYVTGYKWGAFAVLIGGNKFRYKMVDRDDELIEIIRQQVKDFWINHVQAGVAPEFDGSEASEKLLSKMHPDSNGEQINWSAEKDKLIETYLDAKGDARKAAENVKHYENQIKSLLGDYEEAHTFSHKVSWKSVARKTVDSKKLKAERPDIYQQYTKESNSRRFSVN